MGRHLAVAARADVLTISVPAGQAPQLRLQGVGNKDYAIQTTGDLAAGNWLTLSTGATDAAGLLQASDSSGISAARFYRGARLPGLQTTTSAAATVPGTLVTITLGGNDPLNSGGALAAIITQFPTTARSEQWDYTPITAVGTVVTDSQNRVGSSRRRSAEPRRGYQFRLRIAAVQQRGDLGTAKRGRHLHPNWGFPASTTSRTQADPVIVFGRRRGVVEHG